MKPTCRLSDPATRRRTAWTAVVVYALVLTCLLAGPRALWFLGHTGQDIEQTVDRTVAGVLQHVLAYAVFGCLLDWALRGESGSRQLVWTSLAIGHGIATEAIQWFVPLRYCDWMDGLANVVGVGLGWLAATRLLRTVAGTAVETVA